MIALVHTATPEYRLTFVDGERRHEFAWQADRQLARDILRLTETALGEVGKTWHELSGVGVFQGPGSYTGLRIGLTVWNTTADTLAIPIVGATGEGWEMIALGRLRAGENDRLVMPDYGGEAHTTTPRK